MVICLQNLCFTKTIPNPFNLNTTITYKISKQSFVSIQIYNSLGEYVASLENEDKSPGIYEVNFSAENLSKWNLSLPIECW